MLTCPAEGCEFRAKSDRALTIHLGSCKKAESGLTSIAEDVDHRWAKRRKVLSSGYLEVIPEVEEPKDANIEVCSVNRRIESVQLIVAIVLSGRRRRVVTSRRCTSTTC